MVLDGLSDAIGDVAGDVRNIIVEKPLTSAAVGVGVVGAGIIGGVAIAKSRKKRKAKTKKGRKRDRTFKSKQKHEKKYVRKRKYKKYGTKGWIKPKTSKKGKHKKKPGIYKTKTGQPYRIMANGKARFIKRKGGKR